MERMSGGEIKVCCLARPPHEPPLSRPSATLSPAQSGGEGRERGRAPVQGFNARIFRGILILTFLSREKEQTVVRRWFCECGPAKPVGGGLSLVADLRQSRWLLPLVIRYRKRNAAFLHPAWSLVFPKNHQPLTIRSLRENQSVCPHISRFIHCGGARYRFGGGRSETQTQRPADARRVVRRAQNRCDG